MSEENKSGDNNKPETEKKEPELTKELKITITKNLENGQMSVQGPGNGQMYDKWVCFGLLEDAKDFIKTHNIQMAQSRIIRTHPTMAQQVRSMFKRR